MMNNEMIGAGVGLLFSFVLVIAATGMADDYALTEQFSVDTESEWNTYQSSGTATVNADGYIELTGTDTTGNYDSVTLDANESESTHYVVHTNISDAYNSSATFSAGGITYSLEDGENQFELDSGVDSYSFELNRDADTVSSPEVDSVTASTQKGDTVSLVMYMAAALFLILSLAAVVTRLTREFDME